MCVTISILCFALVTCTEGRLMVGPRGTRLAIQNSMAMHQNETQWNWSWAGPRDGAPHAAIWPGTRSAQGLNEIQAAKLAPTNPTTNAHVSQEIEMQPAVKEGVPPVFSFSTKTTAKVFLPEKSKKVLPPTKLTAEAQEVKGVLRMWDWIGMAGVGAGLLSLISTDQEARLLVGNTSTDSVKKVLVAKNVITPPAKEVQHKSEAGVGLLSIMFGPSGINPAGQKAVLPVRNISTKFGKKDLSAKNGIKPPAKEVEQKAEAGDGSLSGMFAPSRSSPPAKIVEVPVKNQLKSTVQALVPTYEIHQAAKEFEHNAQAGVGLLSVMFGSSGINPAAQEVTHQNVRNFYENQH